MTTEAEKSVRRNSEGKSYCRWL